MVNFVRRFVPLVCCVCFMLIYFTYIFNINAREQEHQKSDLENYNFEYLIQNDICEKEPYLLVLVHSAAGHFEHRDVIRQTIGNVEVIKVAFLLAVSKAHQDKIWEENQRHQDIIQGNFVDSYRNLTYKHVMGLSWASTHCNGTSYVIKMDDDIFADIYQLVGHIKNRLGHRVLQRNVACYHQKNMPVVRDSVSKWFVTRDEYESDTFEDYCSGWLYITTPRVAGLLVEAVKKLPFFWVDDVHVTGTAAQLAKVGRKKLNHLYALETDGLVDWTASSTRLKWDKMIAPTWGDLDLSRRAHAKALKCHLDDQCRCCYKKPTTPKPTTTSTTVKGRAQLIEISRH